MSDDILLVAVARNGGGNCGACCPSSEGIRS